MNYLALKGEVRESPQSRIEPKVHSQKRDGAVLLLNAHDPGNFGHLFFKVAFDAHLERHLRHGAAAASAGQLDRHDAVVGNPDQFHIPAVRLEGGPYCIQSLFDVFFKHIFTPGKENIAKYPIKNKRLRDEDGGIWLKGLRRGLNGARIWEIMELGRKPPEGAPFGAYFGVLFRANARGFREAMPMSDLTIEEVLEEAGFTAR
jgi:hypothetical protein